ncbi:MAG: carboxypeptidase-like regulatory domain-containing protein [Bacteroidota bacterium]|nr:carboxypeptidase-like regulatory domain-containing protein [Bacteroidota bacterium]
MKTMKNFQFKRVLVLSGMAFFSFLLYAEDSGVIKGRVTDDNNQPVEYATAVLKNSTTNKFVTGAVCNRNGEYIIENVEPGEYILSTDMIGYGKKETKELVIEKKQNQVVEENVVMNEIPGKSIVVVAKRTSSETDLDTAER